MRRIPIRGGRAFRREGHADLPRKDQELDRQRARARSQTSSSGSVTTCSAPGVARARPQGSSCVHPLRQALQTGAQRQAGCISKPSNNGKIPMSVRELAKEMGVADDTANKQQQRLEALWLIAATVKGWRGPTHQASTWRLTEYGTNDKPLATRDYLDIEESDFERIENSIFRP